MYKTVSFLDEERHCATLELPPNASVEQIKYAYKRLALRYHPDKNRAPDAQNQFRRVKEAYEYLLLKKEQGLKADSPKHEKAAKETKETKGTKGTKETKEKEKEKAVPKTRCYTHRLGVSFEEMLKGTTKTYTFGLNLPGSSEIKAKKKLRIDIAPGVLPGTRIFGQLVPSLKLDNDIEFLIEDKPHKHFKRIDRTANLLFVKTISHKQWVSSNFVLEIPTLEGETVSVQLPEVSCFIDYQLKGRGLPIGPWSQHRGDIIVNLQIQPPVFDNTSPVNDKEHFENPDHIECPDAMATNGSAGIPTAADAPKGEQRLFKILGPFSEHFQFFK